MPNYDGEARYLIELVNAALHHRPAADPPEGLEEAVLASLICKHRIGGLIDPVLRATPDRFSDALKRPVHEDAQKTLFRVASQEDALEEFADSLQDAGIDFLPLKGAVLRRYYEKPHYRMMGDIDILIRPDKRSDVARIMEQNGYTRVEYPDLYDDSYRRKPILNIEVHVALGKDKHFPSDYFDTLWERASAREDNPCWHEMCHEDFYLYFLIHFAKHARNYGTGIRSLIDLWVLRRTDWFAALDRTLVDRVLREFSLNRFEREMLHLCDVWFEGEAEDEFTGELMRRFLILNSGLYGNFVNGFYERAFTKGEDAQKNKRKIFWRRIFLPRKNMIPRFPVLEKHPYLLPFCWIWRAILVLFRPGQVKGETDLYRRVSEGMDENRLIRDRLGFSDFSAEENGEK